MPALATVIAEIREQHRQRQDYHGQEKSIANRISAIERRADARALAPEETALLTVHLEEAKAFLKKHRMTHERRMVELAHSLPVWPLVEEIRGLGPLGLAQLVGECGDIGSYRSVAALWKRMGVAVMVTCRACGAFLKTADPCACGSSETDRERQRLIRGAEAAAAHGFSPARRAVLYNLGEALVKQNQGGAYRTLYLARKVYERGRMPEASDGHVHARARRYMEKRLLRDLYDAWRAVMAEAYLLHGDPRAPKPAGVIYATEGAA